MTRAAALLAPFLLALGVAACDDAEEVEMETPEGEVEIETEDD